jgi:Icc-related predicted phosphoesterase
MRCVAISDTHNRAERVAIPDGDVLLHAGDHTMRGSVDELERAARWLGSLRPRYRAVITIPGNHDFGAEWYPERARSIFEAHDITWLVDEAAVCDGVRFYGSPWQPWFLDWAFNFPRDDGGAAATSVWAKIPDDTDVLITHGPPFGILDQTLPGDERVGCPHLLAAIQERGGIQAHVFGHIHEGYGTATRRVGSGGRDVLFVNAATCDRERYAPVQPPITFEAQPRVPA